MGSSRTLVNSAGFPLFKRSEPECQKCQNYRKEMGNRRILQFPPCAATCLEHRHNFAEKIFSHFNYRGKQAEVSGGSKIMILIYKISVFIHSCLYRIITKLFVKVIYGHSVLQNSVCVCMPEFIKGDSF